jgi:Leucine-rich repeat (LRR) protein
MFAHISEDVILQKIKPKDYHKVKILNLCSHGLTEIPNFVYNFTNLRELWLDDNKITIIPEKIKELKNLSLLSMKDNNLIGIQAINLNFIKNLFICVSSFEKKKVDFHYAEMIMENNEQFYVSEYNNDCNFRINTKEIWFYKNPVDSNNSDKKLKVPFGCKLYVNNLFINQIV